MRLSLLLLATLLLIFIPASGQPTGPTPPLLTRGTPDYPLLARHAGVAGSVVLSYSLDESGTPTNITVLSGHPLLINAARDHLRSWRLTPANSTPRRVTFQYTLLREQPDDESSELQPAQTEITPDLVRVSAARLLQRVASACPDEAHSSPPARLQPGDFLTLERSGCYGTCPGYRITVHLDGRLEWDGHSFVARTGAHSLRIDPAAAATLLDSFRQPRVWRLCGDYTRSVTDSSSTRTTLHLGGLDKTINDYAASSPSWFLRLLDEIDSTADTHILRHGDPLTEHLIHIQSEYLPKPGRTPLMRAAAEGDLPTLRRLLAEGSPVDATDSSGWTALFYAAASFYTDAIDLLLAAGANPKHTSPNGDTVLMAHALRRAFDPKLARLAANLNAANHQGVTALMLLASEAEPAEIKAALRAGANPRARDNRGHSALDYLEAPLCYFNLIPGYQSFMQITGPCSTHPDSNHLRARRLLRNAAGH